jgi:hypothetical protein
MFGGSRFFLQFSDDTSAQPDRSAQLDDIKKAIRAHVRDLANYVQNDDATIKQKLAELNQAATGAEESKQNEIMILGAIGSDDMQPAYNRGIEALRINLAELSEGISSEEHNAISDNLTDPLIKALTEILEKQQDPSTTSEQSPILEQRHNEIGAQSGACNYICSEIERIIGQRELDQKNSSPCNIL